MILEDVKTILLSLFLSNSVSEVNQDVIENVKMLSIVALQEFSFLCIFSLPFLHVKFILLVFSQVL